MKKCKWLSCILCAALLFGALSVAFVPMAEGNATASAVDSTNVISKEDNILTDSMFYANHDSASGCGGIAILHDGIYSGITEGHGKEVVEDRWDYRAWGEYILWISYDLGGKGTISSVLFRNDGGSSLKTSAVYIGDKDWQTISLNEGNYTPAAEPVADSRGTRWDFTTPVEGRYITFRFEPNKPWQYTTEFSEFAATGTIVPDESGSKAETVMLSSSADEAKIPDLSKNILLGKSINNKPNDDYLVPTYTDGGEVSKFDNFALMFDGKLTGVNDSTAGGNKGAVQDWGTKGMMFDLRGKADISSVLIHANTADNDTYRVHWAKVYVSNDPKTITQSEPVITLDFRTSCGYYVTLEEAVNGRYVAIVTDHDNQYGWARIGELAVFGDYTEKPRDFFGDSLIAGKLPVKTYLSYAGEPDHESGTIEYPDKDEATYSFANLTDGDFTLDTRCGLHHWYGANYSAVQLVDWLHVGYNTHWAVLIYSLGGVGTVNEITLTSSPEPGYYIAGVRYYVADKMANLFKPENLVYDTKGETLLPSDTGEKNLDPAYDVKNRSITADLGAGVRGRYIAIVITRPYPVQQAGYSISRLSQIEVKGTAPEVMDPIFDESKQVVTDQETGISLTIHQKDIDDVEFFEKLGGLKVTKSPLPAGYSDKTLSLAGVDMLTNMMTIDSEMYTLELLDKSGQPITAQEAGDRWISVSFPSDKDYFQGLALVIPGDPIIHRIVNSYTTADGKFIVGGQQPGISYNNYASFSGNKLQIVKLKYNDLDTVHTLNGTDTNIKLVVSQTKGAAAQKTDAFPWAWVIAGAAVIAAGIAALFIFRRRSATENR